MTSYRVMNSLCIRSVVLACVASQTFSLRLAAQTWPPIKINAAKMEIPLHGSGARSASAAEVVRGRSSNVSPVNLSPPMSASQGERDVTSGDAKVHKGLSELDNVLKDAASARSPTSAGAGAGAGAGASEDPDFLTLTTAAGALRIKMYPQNAPKSVAFVRGVIAGNGCDDCKFYRAEPNFLLQGNLPGNAPNQAPPEYGDDTARPIMKRGHVAWAGGGGSPHFWIALTPQPGFGHGHTVWGEVEDMSIVDALMRMPTKKQNWGDKSWNATVFETPQKFSIAQQDSRLQRRIEEMTKQAEKAKAEISVAGKPIRFDDKVLSKNGQPGSPSNQCGSPAWHAYSEIQFKCFEQTRSGQAYNDTHTKFEVAFRPNVEYDGVTVKWGAYNIQKSAAECEQSCKDHHPSKLSAWDRQEWNGSRDLPCNVWAWCNADVCFSTDVHHHTRGECWLKFSESPATPEVQLIDHMDAEFRKKYGLHDDWTTPWDSGVLLLPGEAMNGFTWSPRVSWK